MSIVVGLQRSVLHQFSKDAATDVELVAGVGIAGDVHAGPLVQHRSRVAVDPAQPNLRQVHLIAAELFDVLAAIGHDVGPGDLGENVTTRDLDVHSLAVGTMLAIGSDALVAVTGLRNPCSQIERFQTGLLRQVAFRSGRGRRRPPRRHHGGRHPWRPDQRRRPDRGLAATRPVPAARPSLTARSRLGGGYGMRSVGRVNRSRPGGGS